MNDDTYTPCTKCGRPMKYCKGQCCGKPRGCECKEYGPAVCGVIRQRQPECPYTAVIPSMVVEHADNLKDLCDTFVHVSDLNTTFYIDDKHRTIITWAGPVEYDNYDLVTNSLGLRSQFLIDFANNRGAYYDKVGNYQVFNFGNGAQQNKTLHIYIPNGTEDHPGELEGDEVEVGVRLCLGICWEQPSVVVTDDDGNTITPAQFVEMQDTICDYSIVVHIPAVRVDVGGGVHYDVPEGAQYYHVAAANSGIPATTLYSQMYRDASDDDYAILAGVDPVGLYLGHYEYESQIDYTAQIIITAL